MLIEVLYCKASHRSVRSQAGTDGRCYWDVWCCYWGPPPIRLLLTSSSGSSSLSAGCRQRWRSPWPRERPGRPGLWPKWSCCPRTSPASCPCRRIASFSWSCPHSPPFKQKVSTLFVNHGLLLAADQQDWVAELDKWINNEFISRNFLTPGKRSQSGKSLTRYEGSVRLWVRLLW